MCGTLVHSHMLCVDMLGIARCVPYRQLVGTPVQTDKTNHAWSNMFFIEM